MLNQYTPNKAVYWQNKPYLVSERLGDSHARLRDCLGQEPIAPLAELSPIDSSLRERPDLRRLHLYGAKAYDEYTYDFYTRPVLERYAAQTMLKEASWGIYTRPVLERYAAQTMLEEAIWGIYSGELARLESSEKVVLFERHKPSGEPESVGTAYSAASEESPKGKRCPLYSGGCIDWVLANMHLQAVEVRPHGLHGLTLYTFAHSAAPNDSGISYLDTITDTNNPAIKGLVVAAHVMILGAKYFVLETGHYVREENAQIMAKAPLPTVLLTNDAQV